MTIEDCLRTQKNDGVTDGVTERETFQHKDSFEPQGKKEQSIQIKLGNVLSIEKSFEQSVGREGILFFWFFF